jgi:5-methylthioadenosine/S-adenosylhomocysteine deaminase
MNVMGNIVHTGLASDVDTVIVDGRILMENRQVKTVNEEELLVRAQKTTERLWEEFFRKHG